MTSPFGARHGAKRINLSLSDRDSERLTSLVELTNASSQTEVIKRALLTYEALASSLYEGAKFFILEKGEDTPAPLNLLIDVEPKKQEATLVDLKTAHGKSAKVDVSPSGGEQPDGVKRTGTR
jgi:hypothetical protein